jgi:hypothetical protein
MATCVEGGKYKTLKGLSHEIFEAFLRSYRIVRTVVSLPHYIFKFYVRLRIRNFSTFVGNRGSVALRTTPWFRSRFYVNITIEKGTNSNHFFPIQIFSYLNHVDFVHFQINFSLLFSLGRSRSQSRDRSRTKISTQIYCIFSLTSPPRVKVTNAKSEA